MWPQLSGKYNGTTPALRAELPTEGFMSIANSFVSEPLAIESLIVDRSRVLNLSRPDLMRRASYKNIAKGLRRLDELLTGELNKTRGLIRALPAALEVPIEVVEHAIEQTRHRIAEAREASRQAREAPWRAAFRPHAIILTERRLPQPIFVAAFIAVERLLRIDFDPVLVPVSYANKAVAGIRSRLSEFTSESGGSPETLPAFGRPIGVIVNYTPDRAVWFDLDGNPVETFTHAHCPADTYIGLRARPVPPATLRAVMLRFTRLPGEL
jgi:hypothetical protein